MSQSALKRGEAIQMPNIEMQIYAPTHTLRRGRGFGAKIRNAAKYIETALKERGVVLMSERPPEIDYQTFWRAVHGLEQAGKTKVVMIRVTHSGGSNRYNIHELFGDLAGETMVYGNSMAVSKFLIKKLGLSDALAYGKRIAIDSSLSRIFCNDRETYALLEKTLFPQRHTAYNLGSRAATETKGMEYEKLKQQSNELKKALISLEIDSDYAPGLKKSIFDLSRVDANTIRSIAYQLGLSLADEIVDIETIKALGNGKLDEAFEAFVKRILDYSAKRSEIASKTDEEVLKDVIDIVDFMMLERHQFALAMKVAKQSRKGKMLRV